MLGGTRRFFHLFLGVVVGVCVIRQGLGVLFTKSTGWALPSLFFNDALHECNQGLAPFLFALLVVQSMSVDDKYILIYGNENNLVTIRKVALQLIMCLVNCTSKNILWWSLTGLLVGYIATVVFQTYVAEQDDNNEFRRRKPMWRVLWPALKKGAAVISIALPVLLVCNAYYSRDTFDPLSLSSISDDQYLFTFVVMTAPRRGNPPFLTQTLDSYLINWPATPSEGSLYDRLQTVVYTHFSNHTQYDLAHEHFSADARGQHYIKWVRDSGEVLDQRLHVSKALKLAADRYDSTYIALLEDDFPVCGPREWRELEHVVYEANQRVPGHCGLFVATGGSGLFMRPDIARLASSLLLKYTDIPPDVMIQNCLLGVLPECGHCSNTLVTSQTLLMHHIGFNASTSENRRYKQDQWQCGWRHPFNGDPSVITI
ncbi:hypothetical protein DFQ29_003161 [Apophysomyces sp. BC1021]|nr:hypothetical protein DFQ29_003161 [Apophysomyces sp. BC1021]